MRASTMSSHDSFMRCSWRRRIGGNLHGNIAGTLVNVDSEAVRGALMEQFAKISQGLAYCAQAAYEKANSTA